MAIRRGYKASSAGEITANASNAVWTSSAGPLTFTPAPSKDVVVFWNGMLLTASASNDAEIRLFETSQRILQNIEAQEATTPADYRSVGGMYKFASGGSPTSKTFDIELKSETNSIANKAKNFSLTAVELDALDVYAESLARTTTTSATPTTKVTANITPGTTGDYWGIVTWHTDSTAGNFPDYFVRVDGTMVYDNAENPGSKDAANRYPACRMFRVNLTAAAHTVDLQFSSPFGGAVGCEEARILLLRCDVGDEASAQDLTEQGGAGSTTYADTGVSLTDTPNAGDYLVMGALKRNAESVTISSFAKLLEGATTLLETNDEHTTSYCTTYDFYMQCRTLAASSTVWKWQTKVESGTDDNFADGAIAIIQLDTVGIVTLSPSGLSSGTAFGAAALGLNLAPASVNDGSDAFGTTSVSYVVAPAGVADADGFGAAQLDLTILPAGLAGAASFGAPALTLHLLPTGIDDTADGIGAPSIAYVVAPASIDNSTDGIGAPRLDLVVLPAGLASASTYGVPALGLYLAPASIDDQADGFGAAAVGLVLLAAGHADPEAFGGPTLTFYLAPAGLADADAFGAVQVELIGGTDQDLLPASLDDTADGFGAAALGLHLTPAGIDSSAAIGGPAVGLWLEPAGLPDGNAFGAAALSLYLLPAGLGAGGAFGAPRLDLTLLPAGHEDPDGFGAPRLDLALAVAGLNDIDGFGAAVLELALLAGGVPAANLFGAAALSFDGVMVFVPPERTAVVPSAQRLARVGRARRVVTVDQAHLTRVGASNRSVRVPAAERVAKP